MIRRENRKAIAGFGLFVALIMGCGFAIGALGGMGCAAAPPAEAAFPEAFAAQEAQAASATVAKPAAAAPVAPAPLPPPSKDLIEITVGREISDTYRLTYQVDDGNAWASTTEIPSVLQELQLKQVMKRSDGSAVLAVTFANPGTGDILNAAQMVKAGLTNGTVPTLSPDQKRVTFTFVGVDSKSKAELPGSVVVMDLGMYQRFAVIVGFAGSDQSALNAYTAETAVKLAAATIRLK